MTEPGSGWLLLFARLPACIRAQGRDKAEIMALRGPSHLVQRTLLLHSHQKGKELRELTWWQSPGASPWGLGGLAVSSLCLVVSQLPHQHIHLHSQQSAFYLVSKNPKLSNNPGEKLTFLCLSNETLLIRYRSYGMKSLTTLGWHMNSNSVWT